MAPADVGLKAILAPPTTMSDVEASGFFSVLRPPPGLELVKPMQMLESSETDIVKFDVSSKSGAQRRKRKLLRKTVSQKRYCSVWRDPQIPSAIVRLSSASLRTALLSWLNPCLLGDVAHLDFGGIVATVKKHFDWQLNQDVTTELFVSWQPSTTIPAPTAEAIADKIDRILAAIVKRADASALAPDASSLPKINLV
eukprot:TRINITY_DN10211_c0_g1_i1.p1 TRINITY_DN10211_c0_g1~~TRINITY_DN10211_c0_g1_i1.p1  ORF type:complete len:220 (+),score=39.47 TRINITY_DN10211_c0_g1_i1:72-662(+)